MDDFDLQVQCEEFYEDQWDYDPEAEEDSVANQD